MPTIDNELCMGCGKCMDVCGFGALIFDVKAIPNNEKCISCGMCKGHCPFNAITVKDVEKQEKIRQIKKWALAYAKVNGFNVNPDEKVVDTIIEGLLKKEGKFGARYCPCRIQNVRKNVCPCVYHKDEIKKDGACHCLFFVK